MTHSTETPSISSPPALSVLERLAADVILVGWVDDPDWRDTYQTWMAYVPDELRVIWSDLSRETRLAIVIVCDELVSRERYD